MTNEFLEVVVANALKNPHCCFITIPKGTLLRFSPEERAFIEKHVQRYYRHSSRAALRPKSLEHFLADRKYEMDDVAEVVVEVGDLKEAGFVDVLERGGFWYWTVGGRELDPKEYRMLYLADSRTVRTLMKELGYLEIYDAFKDIIEPSKGWFGTLVVFSYMGLNFELRKEWLVVSADAKFTPSGVVVGSSAAGSNATIVASVRRPTLSDVHMLVKHVNELGGVALLEARKLKEYVLSETGIDIPVERARVSISSKDYNITELRVSMWGGLTSNRKKVSVDVVWDKAKGEFEVKLLGEVQSYYVAESFRHINPEKLGVTLRPYHLDVDWQWKSVELGYRQVFKGVSSPPPISEHYGVVSNVDGVLSELLKLYLERIKGEEIHVCEHVEGRVCISGYGTGISVGEFLSLLSWDPTASLDEVALKLIATKCELTSAQSPEVFNHLVAQAVLAGHPQDKLMDKVNGELEAVVNYVARGRLALRYVETPHGTKAPRVYLDGRDLGMRVESLPHFERMVKIAKVLVSPVEEELATRHPVEYRS